MKSYEKVFLVCFLILFLCISVSFAEQEPAHKEDELLVKFKPRVSLQTTSISHARVESQVIKHFRKTGIQLVKLKAGLTVKEALELYKKDPNIQYAEPNYILYALDVFPNDSLFNNLWGLHNTGQTGGTIDADIDAPEAWQITTGSSDVIVGVIDTGVDYNHQDLKGNMWKNPAELNGVAGVDDDGNGYIDDKYGIDAINNDGDPMDDNGHGTHCSGTIGAKGNNGIGVVGVNWNVKTMALKFLGADGKGPTSDAIECLEYAIIMKQNYGQNIRITSNSWGCFNCYSKALYDAIQAAGNADILFVAAAGNDSVDNDEYLFYPSSYDLPYIVAVAATDHNDNIAWFSNWGLTTVDVAAPGLNIISSTPGNNYDYFSGTSVATPYVSGLGALILARHPEYTWDQIKWNIFTTVDLLNSLNGLILTGGRINANNALTCNPSFLHILVVNPRRGFEIGPDEQVVIRALAGTCAGQAPNTTVTVDFNTGQPTLQLRDDGVAPDRIAYDGEYAGYWTPQITPDNCDLILTFNASAPGYTTTSTEVQGKVLSPIAITIITPNDGEIIPSGSTFTLRWSAPPEAVKFDLMYSLNNGTTWNLIANAITGASYNWKVPKPRANKRKCLVKVTGHDASDEVIGEDISDSTFTIEVIKLTSPDGGETLKSGTIHTITWQTNGTARPVAKVKLFYTINGGTTWTLIKTLTGNPDSYNWKVPNVSSSSCKVKVVLKNAGGITIGKDVSDIYFAIQP